MAFSWHHRRRRRGRGWRDGFSKRKFRKFQTDIVRLPDQITRQDQFCCDERVRHQILTYPIAFSTYPIPTPHIRHSSATLFTLYPAYPRPLQRPVQPPSTKSSQPTLYHTASLSRPSQNALPYTGKYLSGHSTASLNSCFAFSRQNALPYTGKKKSLSLKESALQRAR